MKAVVISIQPRWCELIASGKQTVLIMKSELKIDMPVKCYIYEPRHRVLSIKVNPPKEMAGGKVVGEFICDRIEKLKPFTCDDGIQRYPFIRENKEYLEEQSALDIEEINFYGVIKNNGCYGLHSPLHTLHFLHITDLVIYDKPKELSEFYSNKVCKDYWDGNSGCDDSCGIAENNQCRCGHIALTRPPQSWCYVEKL